MHTLFALLTVAAVCVLARPPGLMPAVTSPLAGKSPHRDGMPHDYLLPRMLIPPHPDYTDSSLLPRHFSKDSSNDWLNKEINRIEQMQEDEARHEPRMIEFARRVSQDPLLLQMYTEHGGNMRDTINDLLHLSVASSPRFQSYSLTVPHRESFKRYSYRTQGEIGDEQKDVFAYTPLDKGYYDQLPSRTQSDEITIALPQKVQNPKMDMLVDIEPPRQIRQNPNLSKTKTLVAENLDKLRIGLSHEYGDGTERPGLHFLEAAADPANSIYSVAIIAAVSAALAIAILGFAFGWYTLSRKAKAAADVDYPAYGVTGPTLDMSGDRKLAHSAHMYHYQHQKQQIIAMERSGLDQRNGSVSDPESEDENEEGDYTVYECPGFATTGDMEVKNPLFSDDPTPATPGKCEVVKQQPKE